MVKALKTEQSDEDKRLRVLAFLSPSNQALFTSSLFDLLNVVTIALDASEDGSASALDEDFVLDAIDENQPELVVFETDLENTPPKLIKKMGKFRGARPVICLVESVEDAALQRVLEKGGVPHVVSFPLSSDQLYLHIQTALRQKQAYIQASESAKSAMRNASDLGVVMGMLTKMNAVVDIRELLSIVSSVFSSFDLNCASMVIDRATIILYPDDMDNKTEATLTTVHASESRIFSKGRFIAMNTPNLVVLLTNAPLDDPELYGHYRDIIAYVVAIAEAKLKSLLVDQIVEKENTNAKAIVDLIRKDSVDYHVNMEKIMNNLSHDLEFSALSLDLQLEEEEHLLRLADQASRSLGELNSMNVAVEVQFERLLDAMQHIMMLSRSDAASDEDPDASADEDFDLF